MPSKNGTERSFWIVSPNVANQGKYWRDIIIKRRAAFMGWSPKYKKGHNQIGYRFAHMVRPGDVMLIARRHRNEPELVGIGAVVGPFKKHLKGFRPEYDFGSLRLLRPFKALTSESAPQGIMHVLRHHIALRKLDPSKTKQTTVCEWMQRELQLKTMTTAASAHVPQHRDIRLAPLNHKGEPEYKYKTRGQLITASRKEDELVGEYRSWLNKSGRNLSIASYKGLRCDAYEQDRSNLIEAKCARKREFIRMAVGQLLDYAYLGRERLKKPHLAILVPERPQDGILGWLRTIDINVVWKEGNEFKDNANGKFT